MCTFARVEPIDGKISGRWSRVTSPQFEMIISTQFGKSICVDEAPSTAYEIVERAAATLAIPSEFLRLSLKREDSATFERLSLDSKRNVFDPRPARLEIRLAVSGLVGGKGGFGTSLKSSRLGRKSKKTNNDLCRDLSGRLLRDVRAENAPKTQKKESSAKTVLCGDWSRARKRGRAPPPLNAPRHWGCPRGAKCTYAHGDAELVVLRSKRIDEEDERVSNERKRKRSEIQDVSARMESNSALVEESVRRRRRKIDDGALREESTKTENDDVVIACGEIERVSQTEFKGLSKSFATVLCPTFSSTTSLVCVARQTSETSDVHQIGFVTCPLEAFSLPTNEDGVGDVVESYAVDLSRKLFFSQGNSVRLDPTIPSLTTNDAITLAILRNEKDNTLTTFVAINDKRLAYGPTTTEATASVFPAFSLNAEVSFDFTFSSSVESCENARKLLIDLEKQRDDEKKRVLSKLPESDDEVYRTSTSAPIVDAEGLAAAYDAQVLKELLISRGVKCGGTLEQRAKRLWAVKGLNRKNYPKGLRAKGK